MKCCLCGKTIEGIGHNPDPLSTNAEDRCCDACNGLKVIPTRLGLIDPEAYLGVNGPTVAVCRTCGTKPVAERKDGLGIRFRCPKCLKTSAYCRTLKNAIADWEAKY